MSDMGDTFRAMREHSKRHKWKRADETISRLEKMGIPYELKNRGAHVIIRLARRRVGLWPTTGRFRVDNAEPPVGCFLWPFLEQIATTERSQRERGDL